MAKILWHSVPPWAPSAYGTQSALIARELRASGHDVTFTADSGLVDGPITWDGFDVYPAPSTEPGVLSMWAKARIHPEVVITFVDAFRMDAQDLSNLDVISWMPVHATPLEEAVASHLRSTSSAPVAISAWGRDAFEQAGFIDTPFIPLGIDRSIFRPLDPDRSTARRMARNTLGLAQDAFLVGVVATNVQPMVNRKSFPEIVRAFGIFARRHKDAALYLHTDQDGARYGGEDLTSMLSSALDPGTSIVFTAPDRLRSGLTSDQLACLYNSFDVLCAPSASEGFCVPLIEAQACGIPVIASNSSAQPENVGAGWLVDGQPRWAPWEERWWFTPSIESLVEALEFAFADQGGSSAQATAFAARFDHRRLIDQEWARLLEPWGPR